MSRRICAGDSLLLRVLIFAIVMLGIFYCRAKAQAEEAVVLAPKTHSFYLLGGYGPDGLQVYGDQKNASVEPFSAPLWGAQYSQVITDPVSVSALFLTGLARSSKTFTGAIGIGYSW